MTLDDVIRHNEQLLTELQARYDLAKAAELMNQMADQKSAATDQKTVFRETDTLPQSSYETQTYQITGGRNDAPVTQQAPLPESPEQIRALIDIVEKSIEVLHQVRDAQEINKDSVTGLIVELNEIREGNKYFQDHFKEVMTPDNTAQFVSDPTPHPDPISAGILLCGIAAGIPADAMGGKWIVETAKEFAVDMRDAAKEVVQNLEQAPRDIKREFEDSLELNKLNLGVAVEMAKEAYNEGVEKLKEIANAVLQKTMDSLGDPVLSDKQKQQEKELEKFAAETMQNAMKQGEKTCEARNIEGEAKHKYMEKVQDAAQALIDKKREDQAKELVRTIEVEEQHRARW
jgi:hypothetical protein